MTIQEVRALVRKWKLRLNLQDWKIKTRWAKPGEIPEQWAVVTVEPEHGKAVIIIHEDQEYHEFWLIHELGHVVFAGLSKDGLDVMEDRAVNRYARSLAAGWGVKIPTKTVEQ